VRHLGCILAALLALASWPTGGMAQPAPGAGECAAGEVASLRARNQALEMELAALRRRLNVGGAASAFDSQFRTAVAGLDALERRLASHAARGALTREQRAAVRNDLTNAGNAAARLADMARQAEKEAQQEAESAKKIYEESKEKYKKLLALLQAQHERATQATSKLCPGGC
jgi:hypothetical protein